ncbi:hypothetical protein [Listeria booriae]|uniref:hypothetical protein n=1 Tax=Listeria booriae TaxID=1552123 RepID=UPI001623DB20|nr:hypothetical protein [Listeria booriae]MBC1512043.1 hypothetical protein [Listeria booriae]MBC6150845.1 hypothetical protein [Listeria booriae]MBC6305089.1 hypothetical protein [Listeria booriae]
MKLERISQLYIHRDNITLCIRCTDEQKDFLKKHLNSFFTFNDCEEHGESWTLDITTHEIIQDKLIKHVHQGEKLFLIDDRQRYIYMVKPYDLVWRKQYALRFIRDFFRNEFVRLGYIFFHGGVISKKNIGLAFLGEKKSGKTTTIINGLKQSFNFITNDDVSVQIKDMKVLGYGWPRSISIRKDTLINIPQLMTSLKVSNPDNFTASGENFIFLYPNELASVMDIKIIPCTEIKYFIFPKFNSSLSSSKLTKLSYHESTKLLELNHDSDVHKYYREFEDFFNLNLTTEKNFKEISETLISQAEFYLLEQNMNTMESSQLILNSLVEVRK